MRSNLLILTLSVLLISCNTRDVPNVASGISKIEIGHFDHSFYTMDSANLEIELQSLEKVYPKFFESSQNYTELISRYNDLKIKELFLSVDSVFDDTLALNLEIKESFNYFHHYFPLHDSMTIYSWVSNFESLDPVTISNRSILVSLDLYLGVNSRFYKSAPLYIKERFDKRFLVSDIMHAYFRSKIPFFNDNTLLSSMLYYGKIHYLSSLMIPDKSPEIVMKYTEEKMDWCFENEGNIWAYFVENKLLFSSTHQNKQRFIEDAPFSKFHTKFDAKTPGRIGQWVGYRMVASYMNLHPEKSLTDLINELDSQIILRESAYKPKR